MDEVHMKTTRRCGHPFGNFSLSKAGQCTRALAFSLSGYAAEEFSPLAQARMDLGYRYQALVLAMLRAEGVTITDEERCVEIDGVLGHLDAKGIWPDGRRWLIEIKSGGKRSVDDFAQNGLQFGRSHFLRTYYAQVQAYLQAEQMDEALVIFAERPDGEAETLASDRELVGLGKDAFAFDPLDEMPVKLTRVERQVIQRSNEAWSQISWRLRAAQDHGQPGHVPPEHLREHKLRPDGTLQVPCGWFAKGRGEGCEHRVACFGPLVEVRRASGSIGLMPRSEFEF